MKKFVQREPPWRAGLPPFSSFGVPRSGMGASPE